MKTRIISAIVMVAAGASADDCAPAGSLKGRWKVLSIEFEGVKAPEAAIRAIGAGGWIFDDEVVTFDDPNAPGKSRYRLDATKEPKTIDLVNLDGPQKGLKIEGIYKVEGDRLTICMRSGESAAKGRPTRFATEAGSGLAMIVQGR